MATIETTRDYSLFQRIGGNRKLYSPHIKKLADTIAQNPSLAQFNPILVNDKYEVIDGQHRLEALKRLKQPVHYIKAKKLGLEDVQTINANQKVWSPIDYAKSYAELGKKDYQLYLDFKKEFKLNHDILLNYLSLDTPMTPNMFRNGKFKVSKPISEPYALCTQLTEVGKYFKGYKRRAFAQAFLRAWSNPEYDHDRMLTAIKREAPNMADRPLEADALRDLEGIYNWHYSASKQVRFF